MTWYEIAAIVIFELGMLCIVFRDKVKEILHMWFRNKKLEDECMETINKVDKVTEKIEAALDEWIWVEGYKATDKDMKCRDYQYTLGELHNMPNEADIKECESGFHLCKKLTDVFHYYRIGDGHRFFKVRALVRKSHYERYGKETEEYKEYLKERSGMFYHHFWGQKVYDKMVARSIIFERELTPDEILGCHTDVTDWADKYKKLALETDVQLAVYNMKLDTLTELGFSEAFARMIIEGKKYDIAKSVGSQSDLSMDMKCWLIFKD